MGISIQKTVMPDGKVKEHLHGLKILKVPLTDKEFNTRSKNAFKQINKLYNVK